MLDYGANYGVLHATMLAHHLIREAYMNARTELHRLVDSLPDTTLQTVAGLLHYVLAHGDDPVLLALLSAPDEDEAVGEDEDDLVLEASAQAAAGLVDEWEAVKRRLLS